MKQSNELRLWVRRHATFSEQCSSSESTESFSDFLWDISYDYEDAMHEDIQLRSLNQSILVLNCVHLGLDLLWATVLLITYGGQCTY